MGCRKTLLSLLRLLPSGAVGPNSAYPEGLGVSCCSRVSLLQNPKPCEGLDMAASWQQGSARLARGVLGQCRVPFEVRDGAEHS